MLYYLKHYETVVACIDLDRKVMEIDKPELFADEMNKLAIMGSDFDKWVEHRVTPGSQKGFNRLVEHLGIDKDSPTIFEELLLKTKGVNVKDRLWLTDDEYNDNSPWLNLLDEGSDLIANIEGDEDLPKDMLNLIYTQQNLSINMDGACEKTLIRLNGNLAICKKAAQHNTCDAIMEEVVYRLGVSLGMDMAPAGYLGANTCYSIIDENIDLIMARDLFGADELDYDFCYKSLIKMRCDKQTLVSYLRMLLFDVLTRQLDRNSCNFGFYKNGKGKVKMYRLYDNGLSLFCNGSMGLSKDTFRTRLGKSEDVVLFSIKELNKLGIKKLFKMSYKSDNLKSYLGTHKEDIEATVGVDIDSIVNWVSKRYEEMVFLMNKERDLLK